MAGLIDGNADSGPGDHTSANVDLICNFVICYQAFASNLYVALILKGMQAGVAAGNSGCRMWSWKQCDQTEKTDISGDHGIGFLANVVWKVNVIYIILASALMGILLELMGRKRGEA